jgi:actin-related protein 6
MGTTKPRAKSTAKPSPALPEKTFIIDNGAYTMKAGYAPGLSAAEDETKSLASCTAVPNAIAKTRGNRLYTGSQLSGHVADCNEMAFRRPVEKGYIVNWEAQKETWEHSFFDEKTARGKDFRVDNPEDTTLVLTEAPNALPSLQRNADEMVMEAWGFGGYSRCVGMFSG